MKVNIKKILVESIDLKKLSFALVDEALEPALKEVVANSENKIDDALVEIIYPVLEAELKKKLEEAIAKLKMEDVADAVVE